MDKETLEKLISDQPKEIKARGILLFNGVADAAAAFQKAPTSSNRRDWEDNQAALSKFAEQLGAKDEAEKPFPTLAEVLVYLKEEGWAIAQSSLYRHRKKEGKLNPQPNGAYARKDVDKYAKTWLKQQSTGKKVSSKMDELQRQKLEKELATLDIELRRKELSLGKDLGRYMVKEHVVVELATRVGILDAGLKHLIRSSAAEWIRLVGGDMGKIGEFIAEISRDTDELLNSYAVPMDFEVIIDADETSETLPEEPKEGADPC